MNKELLSTSAFISWVMKFLLIGLFFYVIYKADYLFAVVTLIAICVSLAPSIAERSHHVTLPFELDLLVTIAMFFHVFLGEGMFFYEKVQHWDKFLHFYGSSLVAVMAFVMVYTFHYTKVVRLNIYWIGFFTVVTALAVGALWEIIEFVIDEVLDREMQNGNADTMWDLIYDLTGGVIAAFLGMVYVIKAKPEERRKMTTPVAEIFKKTK